MTSPIKPPGGGPNGPSSPDGPKGPESVEGPSEPFQRSLDRASDSEASGEAAGPEGVRAVADDLRAGRIDATQAVERLVERALEGVATEALPPAARAELEAQLRRAIADDPNLAALTKDLERGK